MFKLENISTNQFITEHKDTRDARIWYARNLLLKYNITDYQKLKDFLESEVPKSYIQRDPKYGFAIGLLKMELRIIESKLAKVNTRKKQSEIFTFDSLESSQIDDKALNITDDRNRGKILLYTNPIMLGSGIESIRKLPITKIKHLIGHVDSTNFKNCLLNLDSITPKNLSSIDRAIRFYDEQVLRQYFETHYREINLFFLNNKEKKQLAEEQIKDIAEYIADNAKECVWGKLSNSQKKIMIAASLVNKNSNLIKNKGNFIDTISHYTTLTELENGILNEQEVVTVVGGVIRRELKRPIDRFIIR